MVNYTVTQTTTDTTTLIEHLESHNGQYGCFPETVTADSGKGFRRFMLRGKRKVEIETGLIALAHNLSKIGA